MSSFEPESFGKYFLVDKIATGGMAEIFKAKTFSHGGFENLVVIKRILSHLSENEDFVEMFIDEAKVSVALQHANIVRIYDFGRIIDNYFISMECIEGKDVRGILRKLSKQRRYLPLQYAIYIAHEVCRGLDYAHNKTGSDGQPYGIVHRDMSPSNVLVSYEGNVKIADFGIAKTEQNTYTTADGVLKGKFEYMSPEQSAGKNLDHRSDLFSVGIIFYEMLTGRRLFKTDSDVKTLERIKSGVIKAPSDVTSRVPAEVERVVMRALTRDRAARYQSAAEMQLDLRKLLPENLDSVHHDMANFLDDVFKEEITTEVRRLEEGSRVAVEWRDNSDASLWDGHTQTHTLQTDAPRGKSSPVVLILALLAFLVVGAAAALGTALMLWPTDPEVVAVQTESTGMLDITVLPPAKILVNGTLRAETRSLVLPALEPGTYAIELIAEGYEPHEQTIEVIVGETAKVVHMFEDAVKPAPEEAIVEATTAPERSRVRTNRTPPKVRFESSPSGADIYVDGAKIGVTPMSWTKGAANSKHQVELRKAGFRSASAALSVPSKGRRSTFTRTLNKVANTPGMVTVGISGGGWGHVYIDGKQQVKPAPSRYEVPPGKHEIRVVNDEIGLDHKQVVTVTAGGRHSVRARPQ